MPAKGSVILVDDEQNILKTVKMCFESAGFHVKAFSSPILALEALKEETFDMAFYDLKMQPIDGMQLLRETRKISAETTSVIMTAHGSIDSAIEAIKLGAFDYLQKPFEFIELTHFLEKVYEHHSMKKELRSLREELQRQQGSGEIITRNEAVKGIIELASQVAPSNITVLIEGESGTGKELLARLIHDRSPHSSRRFVPVNCAALSETLLESELFGHVKGSFTGAIKDRMGRFEAADGGTVFLDEIAETSMAIQVKLLRFLQSKEFERVGESTTRKVDVRVIAATNKDLDNAVRAGTFREDLFYRLNPVKLRLPPLRDRRDDIPLLVQHFLRKFQAGGEITGEALAALTAFPWKGNVRELENVIERAVILAQTETIQLHHLPQEFQNLSPEETLSLEAVERQHIIKVLRLAKDLDQAATLLGIDPATLWRKRKRYNL